MEMMSEAIDETLDKDEAEEETEELTNQVLDEIGVDIASQLSSAPKGRIASANKKMDNVPRYQVELHLVHKSNDGGIAVVAVLYKFGQADAFLSHLQDGLKELAQKRVDKDEEAGIAVGVVRANELKHTERIKYYRYAGSLTVPPCTENVIWSVMARVREMTRDQAEALKAPLLPEFKSNSRPSQLLNSRIVQVYSRHHSN